MVPIVWEDLGYYTTNNQLIFNVEWKLVNNQWQQCWNQPGPEQLLNEGGGKGHNDGRAAKGEQGKGKRGEATGPGMEEQRNEK